MPPYAPTVVDETVQLNCVSLCYQHLGYQSSTIYALWVEEMKRDKALRQSLSNGRKPNLLLLYSYWTARERPYPFWKSECLQVSPFSLLPLDGFKEALEVACSESRKVVPLNDLQEDCRPVCQGFGEELK